MVKPKILANKRGLHPLPLIVLLIIAFISIGGITLIYLNLEQRAGHAIQIQNINFEETKTTIYVQNTGKGTVTLSSLHIDDKEFALSKENCTVSSEDTTTVEETKTAKITVFEQYQKRINIKIVCEDGTSIEVDVEPPKS
jgi:6-phosphogluconolactonase (cycloisomerase 2 family)